LPTIKLIRISEAHSISFVLGSFGKALVQPPSQLTFASEEGFIKNATNPGIIPIPTASSREPANINANNTGNLSLSLRLNSIFNRLISYIKELFFINPNH
jgi:hypothetical protein